MSNQDDETPFIPPQTPQPFVSDGLTRHQIEAEEEQERERQGNAQPPAPPELPQIPPPIQIKPLLPQAAIPIPPAPASPEPVKPIEPAPDKDAPPKPFDQFDPTTRPADLPQSPMPFDPFDRSTWQRADKANAQDRTHKSLFGLIGDFVSRLFRLEKVLEVVMKQMRDVWPPRITQGGDGGGTTILAVDLSNPTGDPGSDATQCDFHYDVTNSVTGESIATGLAMDGTGRRDPIGTMTHGTKGWGYMKDAVFYLRYADEQNTMTTCSNTGDGGSA